MAKTVTTIRIEPKDQAALNRIAQMQRPTPSLAALVRLAVEEFIERHELNGQQTVQGS
jgi:predicted transcriptional regulator